jgi:hypothetical protein
MAKVYHAKNPVFGFYHKGQPKWPEEYDLVASVETDSIEEAFRLTNHISCAWWDNQEVTTVKKSRSTSVGDIIVTNEGVFHCESTGWKKID